MCVPHPPFLHLAASGKPARAQTMSKRRSDHDETCFDSYRSSGSEKKVSVRNVFNVAEECEDPSLTTVCKVLRAVDELKGVWVDSVDRYKSRAKCLLEQYSEDSQVPPLKYTNQMVEIPLSCDSEMKLHYYENFPFVREPMSISTSVEYFSENMSSFTHFKKIILKNARLRIVPDSMGMVFNPNTKRKEIAASCLILSPNGNNATSIVTNDVLSAANILLEQPRIWRIAYEVIEKDENLSLVDKRLFLSRLWGNLCRCFELMDEIELGVTVDRDCQVRISTILHSYYTR